MTGWLGETDWVMHVLNTLCADTDDDGNFIITPDNGITLDMGELEACVTEEATFYVDGEPHKLAEVLTRTPYGVKVDVVL